MRVFKNITLGFSSGALGGLVSYALFWFIAYFDLGRYFDVTFSVETSWHFLRPIFIDQMLWGAALGLLLGAPILEHAWIKRGLVLGLIPAVILLLYIFPYVLKGDMFALAHGNFAFLFILVLCELYGLITTGWFEWVQHQ